MFLSLLATTASGNTIPEVTIAESLIYALVGFAITFLGVAILILLVWACGKIINSVTGKIDSKKKLSENSPAVSGSADSAEDDEVTEAVKVAIIAAIAAYYDGEQNTCEFKVKRIKRI